MRVCNCLYICHSQLFYIRSKPFKLNCRGRFSSACREFPLGNHTRLVANFRKYDSFPSILFCRIVSIIFGIHTFILMAYRPLTVAQRRGASGGPPYVAFAEGRHSDDYWNYIIKHASTHTANGLKRVSWAELEGK
jgi:hypothetical protein